MTNEINIQLGKRVRARRRLLRLSQKMLANAIGVRFQQIQKYECAANAMSAARLWQLSEALDVPITYFFEGLPRANAWDAPQVIELKVQSR
jgi:transcriptional regulator with XRE-family HTH domain